MSTIRDDWIAQARATPIHRVAIDLGAQLRKQGKEFVGSCLICGGDDRFSVSPGKGLWNCRGCGNKGGDPIDLVMHVAGIDFNAACEKLTGTPAPAATALPDKRPNGANGHDHTPPPIIDWKSPEREFLYADEKGSIIYKNVRYRKLNADGTLLISRKGKPDKTFRQERRECGKWISGLGNVKPVPYRLPELIKAVEKKHSIFIVEGEAKADTLRRLGFSATSIANKECAEAYAHLFDGIDVALIPDNDQKGIDRANEIGVALTGKAKNIILLKLPRLQSPGDDIEEWLDKYGGNADELERLYDNAPLWRPPDESAGTGATTATSPQWPDPRPLPSSLLPVKPFSVALLPQSIGPWVEDIADRMQCPPDFVGIPAMTALGAVIGNRIGIRPQRRTDWLEVGNLWACIIGRPGVLKSPAMAEAMKPLQRLEAKARESNQADRKRYEAEMAVFKIKEAAAKKGKGELPALDEPEEPLPRRYIASDATYEALGEILTANPNGVLAFRDELISLLKTLDDEKYVAARGFFLTAWSGTQSYTFDRIIRGHSPIDAACLSMVGSTQPVKIAEYVRKAVSGEGDDGMIQRFNMMVWPDHGGEWRNIDRYPDTEARRSAWQTFEDLDKLTAEAAHTQTDEFGGIPFLRFDNEAQETFNAWRQKLEKRLRAGQLPPAMESHFAKYRKLVPALALIGSLADGMTGRVDDIALKRAIAFADYLESHAHRIYAAGKEATTAAAKAILTRIRKGDLIDGFTCRSIHQNNWSNLSDASLVQTGLDLLVDFDWLTENQVKTSGRPKITYLINPKVVSGENPFGAFEGGPSGRV